MRRIIPSLIAVLGLGAVIISTVSAQAPGPTSFTLKELNEGGTFAFVDNAPRSKRKGFARNASLGDQIVGTSRLGDTTGARVGTSYVACTVVIAGDRLLKATVLCQVIYKLTNGTLNVQVLVRLSDPPGTAARGAVTGGTGAYANARGTVVSVIHKSGETQDTFTLVP